MSIPEYAKIGEKLYKINTDFKVALRCEKVAIDDEIEDTERALAIIFLLFGEEGLNNPNDYEELIKKATIYLKCGKDTNNREEKQDMDFDQDKAYIRASFYTDYNIPDIYKTNMHWYDFIDLMNGLKGDCVLNRVREIRNFDTNGIKDQKFLSEIAKQKEAVALKKKAPKLSKEQEESVEHFIQQMNFKVK